MHTHIVRDNYTCKCHFRNSTTTMFPIHLSFLFPWFMYTLIALLHTLKLYGLSSASTHTAVTVLAHACSVMELAHTRSCLIHDTTRGNQLHQLVLFHTLSIESRCEHVHTHTVTMVTVHQWKLLTGNNKEGNEQEQDASASNGHPEFHQLRLDSSGLNEH